MEVVPAIAAWAAATACQFGTVANGALGRHICGTGVPDTSQLVKDLSAGSQILLPGDDGFTAASSRWNVYDEPTASIIIVPSAPEDVAKAVKFANAAKTPFLAVSGAHGAISSLGNMNNGIEINLKKLNSVTVAADGKTATIGGGALSKTVVDALWAAGKQTVTGTCECTSHLGPGLGGGHGWLQGHYGLISDQFVSMDVVLADGSLRTIDAESDLWWAMKGAGHNFGIVTKVTTKVFDIKHRGWARETMIFTGDKVEAVFDSINKNLLKNGTQDIDVVNWAYMLNIPAIDANKPVIVLYLLQEGVEAVDAKHSTPFKNIGPVNVENKPGSYLDLPGWTMIALDSEPCQKAGLANIRFPLYIETYDTAAIRSAYDLFAKGTHDIPEFANSIFLFEGYALQGLRSASSESSAFAFRGDNVLTAPLISYKPTGKDLNKKAVKLGEDLRKILHTATGRKTMHAYINYAFRDTSEEMYGEEEWRHQRLGTLKKKYDPHNRFSFYAPIA